MLGPPRALSWPLPCPTVPDHVPQVPRAPGAHLQAVSPECDSKREPERWAWIQRCSSSFFKYNCVYLFIFGCAGSSLLCYGLALFAASRLRCPGFSLQWLLLLRSPGSKAQTSVAAGHGFSCSATCGIFPDQRSNSRPLHLQANSYALSSPEKSLSLLFYYFILATIQ